VPRHRRRRTLTMDWVYKYRLRSYFRNSIWVPAIGALLFGLVAVPVSRALSASTSLAFLDFGVEGAQALMAAFVAATFSFMVFVFSSLLVAVQIASAQLSPRIIASLFRDPAARRALAIFVFTFIYDVGTLARIEDTVPQLSVFLAVLLTIASIAAFLHLIDAVGGALRPATILRRFGERGLQVIGEVYPRAFDGAEFADDSVAPTTSGSAHQIVVHTGSSGVLLAFDAPGLVEIATRAGGCIFLLPQVGDFVASGEVLCEPRGARANIDEHAVRQSIAIGPERTPEQDPAFAFRVIVDVAAKALSPAINDPTTAVLAIDQLHRLIGKVANRRLDNGEVRDTGGVLRLFFRMPDREDFVSLAISEIRLYGASSLQVSRRLHALLASLLGTVPAARRPALRHELELLDRGVERAFDDPMDRARARVADSQGLGAAR
jgi:uncharacterized membrane protein